MKKGYPRPGELIVCKVKSIKDYGAFVELLEYDKEGFVHVSNVASGWVKNIRSHLSVGKICVAGVVRVNTEKDLIDVSLRKVTVAQQKRRLNEWKRQGKAAKLLERVAKRVEGASEKDLEKVSTVLENEFGELFAAFEECSASGLSALSGTTLPPGWAEGFVAVASESVSPPKAEIRGTLNITIYEPNGVEVIKQILAKASGPSLILTYVGAPKYDLVVTAPNYQSAESILNSALKTIEQGVAKVSGQMTFERAQR